MSDNQKASDSLEEAAKNAMDSIDKGKTVICPKNGCGSIVFTTVFSLKEISKLLSQSGQTEFLKMELVICIKCGSDLTSVLNPPTKKKTNIIEPK